MTSFPINNLSNTSSSDILYAFISCVFIFAGIMRLMYYDVSKKENDILYEFIPHGNIIIGICEIILGIMLWTRYHIIALYILAIGIVIFTIRVMHTQYDNILNTVHKTCTYRGTASAVILHITYFVIIIYLIIHKI